MIDIEILNRHDGRSGRILVELQDLRVVYVGRPSPYGNPYTIGKDGTREEVIRLYEEWIDERPQLIELLDDPDIGGLECWCAPLPCHAEVLRDRIIMRRKEQTMTEVAMEARCMKCRENVAVNDGQVEEFEVKGRTRYRLIGACSQCEGKVFKFLSAEAGQAALAGGSSAPKAKKALPLKKKRG